MLVGLVSGQARLGRPGLDARGGGSKTGASLRLGRNTETRTENRDSDGKLRLGRKTETRTAWTLPHANARTHRSWELFFKAAAGEAAPLVGRARRDVARACRAAG